MRNDQAQRSVKADLFKRSGFSERIVELIRRRESNGSIVIGINGPWGQGKTTVLNFVLESLEKDFPQIVTVKFNPWIFGNEDSLLRIFFESISKEISRSLTKQSSAQLEADLKQLGRILTEYTDTILDTASEIKNISFLGITAQVVRKVVKRLTSNELESRKESLSKLLQRHNRKVVIVIDDIDRLAKDEVYGIFRLIKLNADFDRFFYLLAYDGERVAEALGERFGESKEAGAYFLEKIVQVPLDLPEIPSGSLSQLFFETFNEILTNSKVNLHQRELTRFQDLFELSLLPKLKSPRKVLRYTNAIQFSLPLMAGELNIVDLALVEYLKIFYSTHYNFIKENSELLAVGAPYVDPRESKNQIDERYGKVEEKIQESERQQVKEILIDMFPVLKRNWRNVVLNPNSHSELVASKRIATREYFNRYFTLSLRDGEISDRSFDKFLSRIKSANVGEVKNALVEFAPGGNYDSLVQKLRGVEKNFSSEESMNVANAIVEMGDRFERKLGPFGFNLSVFSQAAILVARLVSNITPDGLRAKVCYQIVGSASSAVFAFEISKWITATTNEAQLLSVEDVQGLRQRLHQRFLSESVDKPFYVVFPEQALDIILNWSSVNKEQLLLYLHDHVKSIGDVVELFRSIAGRIYGQRLTDKDDLIRPVGRDYSIYISDIEIRDYEVIADSIGAVWLYEIILRSVPETFVDDVVTQTKGTWQQTDENLVKQFMYWHLKTTKGVQWDIDNFKRTVDTADVERRKFDKNLAEEIIGETIVPLLEKIEEKCLELSTYFEDYERQIRITTDGNSTGNDDKRYSWEHIHLWLFGVIRNSKNGIQGLEYSLQLKGSKRSLTNQYASTDVRVQFNEYTFHIIFNGNHQSQMTFWHGHVLTSAQIDELVQQSVTHLISQIK